ncbi:hypothetical protein PENTCL1PPCAC_23566, partial [Pristionchus entomophagus]
KKRREKEEEDEEKTDQNEKWIIRQAKAILRLAQKHENIGFSQPVHPSPAEFLLKAKAAAPAVEDKVAVARVARIQQHVMDLPDSIPDMKKTTTFFEISWLQRISDVEYAEDKDREKKQEKYNKMSNEEFAKCEKEMMVSRVVAPLRATSENLPEEMLRKLQGLSTDKLARVVLLDWMDRLAEEKRMTKHELETRTNQFSAATLHDMLRFAGAASILPDEQPERRSSRSERKQSR